MYEELKLIDVTIDDGYRFGLRILRFIIGKRHSQTLGEYIGKATRGEASFHESTVVLSRLFL